MPTVSATQPKSAIQSQTPTPFKFFLPDGVKVTRSKSLAIESIEVKGTYNKSQVGTVRFNAKTGKFTSTKKFWNDPKTPAPKAMTQAELKDFAASLEQHIKTAKNVANGYFLMLQNVKKALKPPAAQPVFDPAKVPLSVMHKDKSAHVEASMWINLMPGTSPSSTIHASVKLLGTGMTDAPPRFQVTEVAAYAKGSKTPVYLRKNPKTLPPGIEGRGVSVVEIPITFSKLDLNKQYTFVVKTKLSGSPVKTVRSDYVPVERVY